MEVEIEVEMEIEMLNWSDGTHIMRPLTRESSDITKKNHLTKTDARGASLPIRT